MVDGAPPTLAGTPATAPAAPDLASGAGRRRGVPAAGLARILAVAAFVYLAWYQSTDFLGVLSLAAIWGLATVGLGLVLGAAGQISLCQASFVLVGAYMYGTIAKEWAGPTLAGLVASAIAGALAALIVSPILRARGYYLAVATIAVSLLVDRVVTTGGWIPGGNAGLIGVPPLTIAGFDVNTEGRYLIVALVLLAVAVLALHRRYGRGQLRRAIQALHKDEDLLAGLGGHASRLKLEVFVIGGLLAGLAGGLYAGAFGYVSDNGFGLVESFALALAVFIGGSTRLLGAVLGAFVYQASFVVLGNDLANYRFLLLGAIVVLAVHFFPRGLLPSPGDFAGWLPARAPRALPPEDAQHHELDPVEPLSLRVAGVRKCYGALTALDDVTLDLRAGSLTALIGPNGAGKTTLLDLVAGDQHPTAGQIVIGGRDLTDTARVGRARDGIARTYQRIRLVPTLSVLDNVLMGVDHAVHAGGHRVAERERTRRALAALADVGLAARADADIGSLTFGQRRLVEMARAIVSRPRLVLLDEPSSGLNDGEVEGFAELIRRLHGTGCTIILVEHNLPFVRALAHDVVALHFGRLLAHGPVEEVFAMPEFQAAYVGETEAA